VFSLETATRSKPVRLALAPTTPRAGGGLVRRRPPPGIPKLEPDGGCLSVGAVSDLCVWPPAYTPTQPPRPNNAVDLKFATHSPSLGWSLPEGCNGARRSRRKARDE